MLCKILLTCSIISGALSSELIVQLMEWRFEDIARECDFLSTAGFTAVQVSPVSENLILPGRPWYERYQIMSYKINTRSGDADAFKKMTEQCAKKGIRVYVDVIFNHMTANQPQPAKGTGGSLADPPSKSYPGVPYNATHFHPTCDIGSDYMNATRVRVCELVFLHDLDQKQEYVREILIRHLNELIDLGATGFRIDAAKHMYPEDLELILNRTKPVPKYGKPFVYQEVPNDSGPEAIHPSDYFGVGSVTEFKFGTTLRRNMDDLTKWQYLTPGTNIDLMRSDRALVFTDNHDRQRDFPFFSYKNPEHYKLANAFLLSWPYGEAKKVMSSFDFSSKEDGPPHNSDDSIKEVTINSNKQCGNGWVCEHRWPEIAAMVQFAKVVKGTDVSNVQASATTMSYQRTGKGFVVLSMNASVHGTFQTGLPKGQYCEIVSGAIAGKTCGGAIVDVNKDGNANLEFPVKANSSLIVALHVEATKGSSTVKFSDIVLLLTSIFTTHLSG